MGGISALSPQSPSILSVWRPSGDRALYRWGLRHVCGIVVQSERQREALARHYGRDATVVPGCNGYSGKRSCPGGIILWAGTIKRAKRPDLFIDLAGRCPDYRFRLVGGAREESRLFDRICREVETLPNVEMTSFVAFVDVEKHFDANFNLYSRRRMPGIRRLIRAKSSVKKSPRRPASASKSRAASVYSRRSRRALALARSRSASKRASCRSMTARSGGRSTQSSLACRRTRIIPSSICISSADRLSDRRRYCPSTAGFSTNTQPACAARIQKS